MEPSIYQELDREIEKLILRNAPYDLAEGTIRCCKDTSRKMIDSGEFTVEQMIQRIKDLNEATTLQKAQLDQSQ